MSSFLLNCYIISDEYSLLISFPNWWNSSCHFKMHLNLKKNAFSMSTAHLPNVSYEELQRWLVQFFIHKRSKSLQLNADSDMVIGNGTLSNTYKIVPLEICCLWDRRKSKANCTTDCMQAGLVFCWCLLRIALSPIASVLFVEPPEAIKQFEGLIYCSAKQKVKRPNKIGSMCFRIQTNAVSEKGRRKL